MNKYFIDLYMFFSMKSSFFISGFCWYFLYELFNREELSLRGITIHRGEGDFMFLLFEVFVLFLAIVMTCVFLAHIREKVQTQEKTE
jgi:hypothetical protein